MKYRVIDMDGNSILDTEESCKVIDAVYNDDRAYAVLTLGTDGEYHIDETAW